MFRQALKDRAEAIAQELEGLKAAIYYDSEVLCNEQHAAEHALAAAQTAIRTSVVFRSLESAARSLSRS